MSKIRISRAQKRIRLRLCRGEVSKVKPKIGIFGGKKEGMECKKRDNISPSRRDGGSSPPPSRGGLLLACGSRTPPPSANRKCVGDAGNNYKNE